MISPVSNLKWDIYVRDSSNFPFNITGLENHVQLLQFTIPVVILILMST